MGTTTSMRKSELCTFMADAGLVCPLQVDDSQYTIRPYQHCSRKVQEAVSAALFAEWQDGAAKEVDYTDEGIRKAWPGGDVLYVASDDADLFMGCVAVDRRNFHPFISHLLVTPSARGRGLGSRLLKHGEEYARCLRMESVKLWCRPHMVPFYAKRGYVLADAKKSDISDIVVMSKDLPI
jgi:GNAT superfamily N-acetyltransferase